MKIPTVGEIQDADVQGLEVMLKDLFANAVAGKIRLNVKLQATKAFNDTLSAYCDKIYGMAASHFE